MISGQPVSPLVAWGTYDAILFDLDGVVTPTAEVHMRAWAEMFGSFLGDYDGAGDTSPYVDADYFAHVDGKPRYEGVADFLASRGIDLPEGGDDDPGNAVTVKGLGNRKNEAFNEVLERDGVVAYPGSVALLDHLRDLGKPLAVVSSSANAAPCAPLSTSPATRVAAVAQRIVVRRRAEVAAGKAWGTGVP